VSRPAVYSDLILQELGDDAASTYFEEEVMLNNIPMIILQYVKDLYANPNAEDMFDFVVEDVILAGTERDNGNLFDFSTFDPCYSPDAVSATAGTDGGPIGAVFTCEALMTSTFEPSITPDLGLRVQPNPAYQFATFTYELKQSSDVRLTVYDMMGRAVATLANGNQPAGEHRINWNLDTQLKRGLYIARLQTNAGEMSLKLMIQ
jgi:hypothetical protein